MTKRRFDQTYLCQFIGGPFDGDVRELEHTGDEGVPMSALGDDHDERDAIYFRETPTRLRFLGITDDAGKALAMCEEERARLIGRGPDDELECVGA